MKHRNSDAEFVVLRSNDEVRVEKLVNKLLQTGSKILDLQMVVNWSEPSGLVVGILHVPGYFREVDRFGGDIPSDAGLQAQGLKEDDFLDGDESAEDATFEGTDEDLDEEPKIEDLPDKEENDLGKDEMPL